MLCNDTLGCCTISGVFHAVQAWVVSNILPSVPVDSDNVIQFSDQDIIEYYSSWDGYVPGNPSTDQGGDELTVLNSWRQSGLLGYQLLAYADPDPQNSDHIEQAINLFGGVYLGIQLPVTAQTQDVWDVVNSEMNSDDGQPGSWGGHAVWALDYDADTITCITWGQLKKMTWQFLFAYCDEAHALISPDWVPLAGFDLATLQADLSQVVG
jgi:hypothetical protein